MSEARPHLDARALAAEREAGTDGEKCAEEFRWDQTERGRRKFPSQDRFDMRNAAPMRLRRIATDQAGGGSSDENEEEANGSVAVRPCDERVAQTARLVEREPEDRADESRQGTGEERDQRERKETALALGGKFSRFLVVHARDHSAPGRLWPGTARASFPPRTERA
jgi:hypothetical protein